MYYTCGSSFLTYLISFYPTLFTAKQSTCISFENSVDTDDVTQISDLIWIYTVFLS